MCPPPDPAINGPVVDKKKTPQWSPHSPHLLMGLELVPKDLGHNQRGGGQRQRCPFSAQLTQFSSHRSGWSDWACKIWTRPKKKKGEKKLFSSRNYQVINDTLTSFKLHFDTVQSDVWLGQDSHTVLAVSLSPSHIHA